MDSAVKACYKSLRYSITLIRYNNTPTKHIVIDSILLYYKGIR